MGGAVMNDEVFYTMALSMMYAVGLQNARQLREAVGSAKEVFDERNHLANYLPDVKPSVIEAVCSQVDRALMRAEKEVEFIRNNQIKVMTDADEAYPQRLLECNDAPMVLYGMGNADLNAQRVVSVVGTRHCTEYGRGLCQQLLADLAAQFPDVLVVSGLAYGIDIEAHGAALANHLPTVGVLAHGLDQIYPAVHRNTAARMLTCGGLLTEYPTHTIPDKRNFVCRNRIVAGMTDAVIVVESDVKGGSLITADMADGYSRDVFAFPGRTCDKFSRGCNMLIQQNKATMIQSADDLMEMLGWNVQKKKKPQAVQREMFVELDPEEQIIMEQLRNHPDGLAVGQLLGSCSMPVSKLTALLFELEIKGMVKALKGGVFRSCD